MNEAQKRMKKYLNAIERRLNLPLEVKARVMADLTSSVISRREAGQTDEQIMAQLGAPREAAAELNRQMEAYAYRKSPWRWLALAAAALGGGMLLTGGVWGLVSWLLTKSMNAGVGVIGGADGPTAIFVASEPTGTAWLFGAALLALGLFGFWKLSRCRQK